MSRKAALEQVNKLRAGARGTRFQKELTEIAGCLEEMVNEASAGGHARAKKLSKKRRSEIARNAALARWGKR